MLVIIVFFTIIARVSSGGKAPTQNLGFELAHLQTKPKQVLHEILPQLSMVCQPACGLCKET